MKYLIAGLILFGFAGAGRAMDKSEVGKHASFLTRKDLIEARVQERKDEFNRTYWIIKGTTIAPVGFYQAEAVDGKLPKDEIIKRLDHSNMRLHEENDDLKRRNAALKAELEDMLKNYGKVLRENAKLGDQLKWIMDIPDSTSTFKRNEVYIFYPPKS